MFFKKKEPKWWEKEAEEHYMTADEYLKLLKLEKENAELRVRCLEREVAKLKARIDDLVEEMEGV